MSGFVSIERLWSVLTLWAVAACAQADWSFVEVASEQGAEHLHHIADSGDPGVRMMSGGVAAADVDRDGDTDLYLVTGDHAPNVLMINDGSGHFADSAAGWGVGLSGHIGTGPTFADMDADGWPDLFVGGVSGSGQRVFRNLGDGRFEEITADSGIIQQTDRQNDYSTAFGDPDADGDLDIFVSHWGAEAPTNHLWLNLGAGNYVAGDRHCGIEAFQEGDWSFSPIFTDIDGDFRQDLLVAGDYESSEIYRNLGGALFERTTEPSVITDENGMGQAVADFDNDGDMDWFVTSIWDPGENVVTWGSSGNRLYRNDGAGGFTDITDEAGVRVGHWGWGACAADFNNDGWLDIFHVNGFPQYGPNQTDFRSDPSLLFINEGDGTFSERAAGLGINDNGQGRGVVCLDADLDGDIDLFVANYEGQSKLYRNDLDDNPGWLQVSLAGEPDNPQAVGAKISLEAGGITQVREVTVGSNFASQNPLVQHFGLGGAENVDRLHVRWPHGGETEFTSVSPDQRLTLHASGATPLPFALEPGMTAAWYDPQRNGEGFVIELLPNERVVAYWFTYDSAGAQDWYIMVGDMRGRRVLFPEVIQVSGGEFGPGFDPAQVTEVTVGEAAFTWTDCGTGTMEWHVHDEYGRMNLERITTLMGLDCGRPLAAPERPEGQYSGSWYDPTHAGEGYTVEVLADSRVLTYWFSFDNEGARRWFFGIGEILDGVLSFEEMLTTRGPEFGAQYDPNALEILPWGSLSLHNNCKSGTASYESSENGFGAGELSVQRLTTPWGLGCEP